MTTNVQIKNKPGLLIELSIASLILFGWMIQGCSTSLIGRDDDHQSIVSLRKTSSASGGDNAFSLRCEEWPQTESRDDLDEDCKILKFFNRTEVELMDLDESVRLARYCACQLHFLDHIFEQEFDSDDNTRRLYEMVTGKLQHDHEVAQLGHRQHVGKHYSGKQRHQQSDNFASEDRTTSELEQYQPSRNATYLWNDVDVTLYGISIYTSSKDYFDKIMEPGFKMDADLKRQVIRDRVWKRVRLVCLRVAQDRKLMYQYLENLARLNPVIFLQLTEFNEQIGFIYQASKACKLLLLEHMQHYKLRPSPQDFVPVAGYMPANFDKQVVLAEKEQQASESINEISHAGEQTITENVGGGGGKSTKTWDSLREDVDLQLSKSSPSMVLGCKRHKRMDMKLLAEKCPMMFEERISANWFKEHSRASDRSLRALECGCQLILHNSTWSTIMQDPSVQKMSKCLTMYLNQNTIPNFMTTPIATLYGWFMEIMHKFSTNRQFTIRQMFDSSFEDGDPLKPINHQDDVKSLETLRRGCNLIMFNYNRNSRFTSELKLIKYLDRLQLLSQDNLFVFHLTLMDPNLFKLHALSKMCEPIIS